MNFTVPKWCNYY